MSEIKKSGLGCEDRQSKSLNYNSVRKPFSITWQLACNRLQTTELYFEILNKSLKIIEKKLKFIYAT